jgi:hypothetical protein
LENVLWGVGFAKGQFHFLFFPDFSEKVLVRLYALVRDKRGGNRQDE